MKKNNKCTKEQKMHENGDFKRKLYFMSKKMNDCEAEFIATFANRMIFDGKFDANKAINYHDYLIDSVLEGLEQCHDDALLDLIRKLLAKSNDGAA